MQPVLEARHRECSARYGRGKDEHRTGYTAFLGFAEAAFFQFSSGIELSKQIGSRASSVYLSRTR